MAILCKIIVLTAILLLHDASGYNMADIFYFPRLIRDDDGPKELPTNKVNAPEPPNGGRILKPYENSGEPKELKKKKSNDLISYADSYIPREYQNSAAIRNEIELIRKLVQYGQLNGRTMINCYLKCLSEFRAKK